MQIIWIILIVVVILAILIFALGPLIVYWYSSIQATAWRESIFKSNKSNHSLNQKKDE